MDTSSSIANDELNQAGLFGCFQSFAGDAVRKLGRSVQQDRFHVAAITYADNADLMFDFNDHIDDRDKIISTLRTIPYPNYGSSESQSNLHLALKKVRVELMTANHGYIDTSRPIVLVVLSDGEVRSDPSLYPTECTAIGDAKACGAKLLAAELTHPIYDSMITLRWVFGTHNGPQLHPDIEKFRTDQLAAIATGSEVYASGVAQQDVCDTAAAESFLDFMLSSDQVRQCDTTQTTTVTTTPVTCRVADLVFVFDLSS